MDLSSAAAFSKPDFDVREWVEAVLASAAADGKGQEGGGGGLEAFISSVSMRLQLLAQELNGELEKGLMDLMASFPRALAELDRLDLSAKDLSADLSHVLAQVDRAAAEQKRHGSIAPAAHPEGKEKGAATAAASADEAGNVGIGEEAAEAAAEEEGAGEDDPVEVLARLHQVKTRMAGCRDTLREAAQWHQLVREGRARLAAGELAQVADQLGQMRVSLAVLASLPEAGERARALAEMEAQLEALLKPQVAAAVQREAVGALQEFAALYAKLGRTEALHAEYARARPAPLHRLWYAFGAGDAFPDWLPGFYKQAADFLSDEKRRCAEAFGPQAAPSLLAALVTETFAPLADSHRQRLLHDTTSSGSRVGEAAASAGGLPFPRVVALFVLTTEFLAGVSGGSGGILPLPSPTSSSASGSIQQQQQQQAQQPPSMGQAIDAALAPYEAFLERYEALEWAALQAWVQRGLDSTKQMLEESSASASAEAAEGRGAAALPVQMEAVLDESTSAFPVASALVARSRTFSHGYHARELVTLIQKFLSADLGRLALALRAARQRCGLLPSSSSVAAAATTTTSTSSGEKSSKAMGDAVARGAKTPSPVPPPPPPPVASSDPTATPRQRLFDWDHLQGALRLLQAVGRHARALRSFEKELAANLAAMHAELFAPSTADLDASSSSPTPAAAVAVHWARARLLLLSTDSKGTSTNTRAAETRAFLRAVAGSGSSSGGAGGSGAGTTVLPGDILRGPVRSSHAAAGDAHRLLFDVCMSVVRDRLRPATVAGLAAWHEGQGQGAGGGEGKDAGGDAAYYSNLPQPYITQVGEHILSLIQHLEDFAASDALTEVLPVTTAGAVERLAEPDWRAAAAALGLTEAEASSLLGSLSLSSGASHATQSSSGQEGVDVDGHGEEEEDLSLQFANRWLHAIASGAVACLLAAVAALPRLTPQGARQLHTDAAYLLTVLANLEVATPPLLSYVHELSGLEESAMLAKIDRPEEAAASPSLSLGEQAMRRRLARKLADARGLVVTFQG